MVSKRGVQAKKNKMAGARFEAEIRSTFDMDGQFIYVKGVSTKGIDVLAMKDKRVVQLELKSHITWKNYQFQEAKKQLIANESIVNKFLNRTVYKPEDTSYILVYYIRNKELIISGVGDDIKKYPKTHKDGMADFLTASLADYGVIDDRIRSG